MNVYSVAPIDIEISLDSGPANPRVTVILTEPPDGWDSMATARVFSWASILSVADAINQRVDWLIKHTGEVFNLDSLSDQILEDHVRDLTNRVGVINFGRFGGTLSEIISRLSQGRDRPLRIAVDTSIGHLQWELLYLGPNGERLADVALILGVLADDDDQTGAGEAVQTGSFPTMRRLVPFDSGIRIRAAGGNHLAGADIETRLVLEPGHGASGSLAPPIRQLADVATFFEHFKPSGYQIVHFFSHCAYDARGDFSIRVSDSYDLHHTAFNEHPAQFPVAALHFLNVCNGAPAPSRPNQSVVEYMSNVHLATCVVASLTAVRSLDAATFAQAFYDAFLAFGPESITREACEALWFARNDLKSKGMAAGYLYRTYGRPDVSLAPRRVMESRQAAVDARLAQHYEAGSRP